MTAIAFVEPATLGQKKPGIMESWLRVLACGQDSARTTVSSRGQRSLHPDSLVLAGGSQSPPPCLS